MLFFDISTVLGGALLNFYEVQKKYASKNTFLLPQTGGTTNKIGDLKILMHHKKGKALDKVKLEKPPNIYI